MLDCWRFGNDDLRGRCLGLPLEPLTLGHAFLLLDYDVDVLQPRDFGELLISVFVCAHPWRESKRIIRSWRTKLFLMWWGFRVRNLKFGPEVRKFTEYLQANIVHPEFVIGQDQEDCASPLVYRLLGTATRLLHQDWDAAMDVPIRTLMAVWAAAAEMRGEIQLWGDRQEEFLAWAREQDELKRKARDGTA